MAAWRYKISLLVLKIFHSFATLTREIFFNTPTPRGNVISSMYDKIDIRNLQSEKHENRCLETSLECSDAFNFISQHFAKNF